MMRIVYFSSNEQFFSEIKQTEGEKVYVAPSPFKADSLRSKFNFDKEEEVITIAGFISSLLEILWTDKDRPKVKRKSEILLIFGVLRNKYLPELTFEQFNHSYNLFSDLRSFTLDIETLSNVLEEQPDIIKKTVRLFWKLIDMLGHIDEQAAYQLICKRLRLETSLLDGKKTYIFWSFQHLNAQQLDLLKVLSDFTTVIIPFPFQLKEKINKNDWISWLKDFRTDEKDLPQIDLRPQASWVSVNSREISKNLKLHLRKGDQIILGTPQLTPHHLDIIPSQNVFFKIPIEILSYEIKEVHEELEKFSGSHIELNNYLNRKISEVISLKHLRVFQLYLESLQYLIEITDEVIPIDSFFINLLSIVTSLNQPRTSFFPLSKKTMQYDLKDFSQFDDIDHSRRVIICIDERFDGLRKTSEYFSDSVLRSLSSIGPVKRSELDFYFKNWEFKNLLEKAEVLILMNEKMIEQNIIWKDFLNGISLLRFDYKHLENKREIQDPMLKAIKREYTGMFSASKIQAYIDCPRKFYFSYVDKKFPEVSLLKDFDPRDSGLIVHEIIERFFKQNTNDESLETLVKFVVDKHIVANKLSISFDNYLHRNVTFYNRARNGIDFIRRISDITDQKIEWNIEVPFKIETNISISGRIDCVGISSDYIFLLDFKSTVYSSHTAKEVLDFEAIQLWVYLYASKFLYREFNIKRIVIGYIVLDDTLTSQFLTFDRGIFEILKKSNLCKVHEVKEEIQFEQIVEKFQILFQKILSETIFSPVPRERSICQFCELNKVCVKNELQHG